MIVKKHYPQAVLLFAGVILLAWADLLMGLRFYQQRHRQDRMSWIFLRRFRF
ncbi:hypothetical protein [Pectinatus frisingensis]|uniref:hypothetical protein n=1 Tax=Pectinatus frisingensis TaxID=865 RepID=UPI0015F5FC0D|nr:hypothetical protein [Pectinatus frisingensis]